MIISKGVISKIHVAKAQLKMDDDTYRAFLQRVAGVDSSKKLSDKQAGRLIEEFKRLGFVEKTNAKKKGKPHNFDKMPAMITKIEALLADQGLPWSYVDSIAKQMFKIERCAWLKNGTQLEAIIAALYNNKELDYLINQAKQLMEKLGYTEDKKALSFKHIKGEFKRRKELLTDLTAQLGFSITAKELNNE